MELSIEIDEKQIESIIDELGKNFKLDRLQQIIFSNNYAQTINRIATTTEQKIDVQDDEVGTSMGKVIPIGENKYIVVISIIVLVQLTNNRENQQLMRHVIQHELAHVHDFTINNLIITNIESSNNNYLKCANGIVLEYVADRLAAFTYPALNNYGIDNLNKLLKDFKNHVNKVIENRNINGPEFTANIISEIHQLFVRELCTIFATLDAFNMDFSTVNQNIIHQLEFNNQKLKHFVTSLHELLDKIFFRRSDLKLLEELCKVYCDGYIMWGVEFKNENVLKILKENEQMF